MAPTAAQVSADVQLSPVTSTIVADASFTGTSRAGNHVPPSSARAKTPVPVDTSPIDTQFPHEVQSTDHRRSSSLLTVETCTVCKLQIPPCSLNKVGMLLVEDVSAPTATQPVVVQLIP
jgi:hypothetical protein